MTPAPIGVFDCNIFLQAMLSGRGAAHACLQKVFHGDLQLCISSFIISEIRRLPEHPKLARRFRMLTPERTERFIEEVLGVTRFIDAPPALVTLARDPSDAHYLNLALHVQASFLITNDKDLLDLAGSDDAAAQAVRDLSPKLQIVTPAGYLGST